MVKWEIQFTNQAVKDAKRLKSVHLDKKAKSIIAAMKEDPFGYPPPFEKLTANLKGKYSRRINIEHRLVYKVDSENRVVIVYAMYTHYNE